MKRSGFTLGELLVVIVIVGILLAIVVPWLSGTRESARQTVCKANLKSQHTVLIDYLFSMRTLPMDMTPLELPEKVLKCPGDPKPAVNAYSPVVPSSYGGAWVFYMTDYTVTPPENRGPEQAIKRYNLDESLTVFQELSPLNHPPQAKRNLIQFDGRFRKS